MSIAGSPKNAVEKALPAMPSCQKACQTFSRQAFRNRHREMELAEPALKQYSEALAGMFTESGDPRERKRASWFIITMSVTVNLSSDELAQIKRLTELDDASDAVTKAAREFLRVTQLRELKAASGKVDYQDVGAAMETLELS